MCRLGKTNYLELGALIAAAPEPTELLASSKTKSRHEMICAHRKLAIDAGYILS